MHEHRSQPSTPFECADTSCVLSLSLDVRAQKALCMCAFPNFTLCWKPARAGCSSSDAEMATLNEDDIKKVFDVVDCYEVTLDGEQEASRLPKRFLQLATGVSHASQGQERDPSLEQKQLALRQWRSLSVAVQLAFLMGLKGASRANSPAQSEVDQNEPVLKTPDADPAAGWIPVVWQWYRAMLGEGEPLPLPGGASQRFSFVTGVVVGAVCTTYVFVSLARVTARMASA